MPVIVPEPNHDKRITLGESFCENPGLHLTLKSPVVKFNSEFKTYRLTLLGKRGKEMLQYNYEISRTLICSLICERFSRGCNKFQPVSRNNPWKIASYVSIPARPWVFRNVFHKKWKKQNKKNSGFLFYEKLVRTYSKRTIFIQPSFSVPFCYTILTTT